MKFGEVNIGGVTGRAMDSGLLKSVFSSLGKDGSSDSIGELPMRFWSNMASVQPSASALEMGPQTWM